MATQPLLDHANEDGIKPLLNHANEDAADIHPEAETIPSYEEVPKWAIDGNIFRYASGEIKHMYKGGVDKDNIPVDNTAGQACLWCFLSLILQTYFLSALPVVGVYASRCSPDPHLMALAPESTLQIIFFLPLVIAVLLCQWKASTYVVLPTVQFFKNATKRPRTFTIFGIPFTVFGEKQRPFKVWYIAMSIFTLLNCLDSFTNALITARVYATKNCPSYGPTQQIWHNTMNNSMLGPFLWITDFDFASCAMFLYVLQLLVQPMFALYCSVPLKDPEEGAWLPRIRGGIKYSISMGKLGRAYNYKTAFDSSTCKSDTTSHGDAMIVLAEANKMELLSSQDMDYRELKKENLFDDDDDTEDAKLTPKKLDALLETASGAFARSIQRFALKGLVQNALQVNVQVTFLLISKELAGNYDAFNAFTVFLTVVGMLVDIPDMIMSALYIRKVNCRLSNCEELDEAKNEERKERLAVLKRRLWILRVCMFVYVCVAMYGLVKLIMGLFVCDGSMWNVDVWNGAKGCVIGHLDLDFEHKPGQCKTSDLRCNFD